MHYLNRRKKVEIIKQMPLIRAAVIQWGEHFSTGINCQEMLT